MAFLSGAPLLLPVGIVNCVQTLKASITGASAGAIVLLLALPLAVYLYRKREGGSTSSKAAAGGKAAAGSTTPAGGMQHTPSWKQVDPSQPQPHSITSDMVGSPVVVLGMGAGTVPVFNHGFCCVRVSIIGLRLLHGARFQ
jgi:hypothetical protein